MAKKDATKPNPKRAHRATYASDKRNGGYLIRVVGPHSNAFAGRDVPVTRKNGDETDEKLERMIWTGLDKETGEPVSLYKFVARPREKDKDFDAPTF